MTELLTKCVPFVTYPNDELGDAVGLNRDASEYRQEMSEIREGLARVSILPPEVLASIAYQIVVEDVPEGRTRRELERTTKRAPLDLGRTSMLALDGGYHTMWAAARAS